MLRSFTTAAILALSITAASAATQSITVNISDLNLSHAQDAKVLAERLASAAKEVCVSSGNVAPSAMHDCMSTAVAEAIASIETRVVENVRVNLATPERTALATP